MQRPEVGWWGQEGWQGGSVPKKGLAAQVEKVRGCDG